MTPMPQRPILMLVTEPGPCPAEIVAAAVCGGVDVVQWRERPPCPPILGEDDMLAKSMFVRSIDGNRRNSPSSFLTPSKEAGAAVCELPATLTPGLWGRGGVPLHIVNVRAFDHLPADADGVHLPEHSMSISKARRQYGKNILIGRSVHSVGSALQAEADGADYIIAGTIFASNSHPGKMPAGPDFLRDVCKAVAIPVIAIGGVTPQNAAACLAAGAAGVAVLSAIMRADDPKRVAEMYREALDHRERTNL